MKARWSDLVTIGNRVTGETVVTMPLWLWHLTGKKPFKFLFAWVVMDYQCDPEFEKSGLWHLWNAFRAWWKFGKN